MTQRTDRLKRLLRVQNKLTAMHEMRRAGLLGQANAADAKRNAEQGKGGDPADPVAIANGC